MEAMEGNHETTLLLLAWCLMLCEGGSRCCGLTDGLITNVESKQSTPHNIIAAKICELDEDNENFPFRHKERLKIILSNK